ncbi:hypothetical protein E2C01_011827 [Portunus trituberculatus]|uniref:Uncharacterized protein n=1 Tax=Portunus trituberculatus TaxID=210409 RepID=A0A5B7DC47_PORTR|nr:hypothetical protein [Portunus trituberculatus]
MRRQGTRQADRNSCLSLWCPGPLLPTVIFREDRGASGRPRNNLPQHTLGPRTKSFTLLQTTPSLDHQYTPHGLLRPRSPPTPSIRDTNTSLNGVLTAPLDSVGRGTVPS